jgi:hypothetical protein
VARIEGEILIGRPVEEVFDFVADERNRRVVVCGYWTTWMLK